MKIDIENPKELAMEITFLNGFINGAKMETPEFVNLTQLLEDINKRFVISEQGVSED